MCREMRFKVIGYFSVAIIINSNSVFSFLVDSTKFIQIQNRVVYMKKLKPRDLETFEKVDSINISFHEVVTLP